MSRLLVADRQSISKDVSSSTLHIEWERGPADVLSLSVLSGLLFRLSWSYRSPVQLVQFFCVLPVSLENDNRIGNGSFRTYIIM